MSHLTLKCEKFGLSRGLHDLLGAEELVDVTLACQGEFLQAHKTVLAACSPHFRALFKMNPWQQPIVFMHDVELAQLKALVDFMYNGEVTVHEQDLPGFLKIADAFKVSGLASSDKQTGNEKQTEKIIQSTLPVHHTPPLPGPPPLAKIQRQNKDRDVSKQVPIPEPTPIVVASTSTQQKQQQQQQPPQQQQQQQPEQQSWMPPTVPESSDHVMMPSSVIKVEAEELLDLTDDQDPISIDMQDCDAGDDDEQPSQDAETSQQDSSWYDPGPSTSTQASSADQSQPGVSGVSSRGSSLNRSVLLEDIIDLKDSNSNDSSEAYSLQEQYLSMFGCTKTEFKCKTCDKTFNMFYKLMEHNKSNHSLESATCSLCLRKFCDATKVQHHLYYTHGIKLDTIGNRTSQCALCLRKFDTVAVKQQHMRLEHPESCFFCRYCFQCFFRHEHRRTHEFRTHKTDLDKDHLESNTRIDD